MRIGRLFLRKLSVAKLALKPKAVVYELYVARQLMMPRRVVLTLVTIHHGTLVLVGIVHGQFAVGRKHSLAHATLKLSVVLDLVFGEQLAVGERFVARRTIVVSDLFGHGHGHHFLGDGAFAVVVRLADVTLEEKVVFEQFLAHVTLDGRCQI
jgi:hypothetical protein